MAVFRVEKTKDYTVMSNHHLRNTALSLKAKGLMSLMLSLPEDWDYTLKGLACICKDGVDSISGAIKELERHGYLSRKRLRLPNGRLGDIEYTIHEQPENPVTESNRPKRENPKQVNPNQVNPVLETPILATPIQAEPVLAKPTQLNTNQSNTEEIKDKIDKIGVRAYRELIENNIEYNILVEHYGAERLDAVVDLMLEAVVSQSPYCVIAGGEFPRELVRARILKLNSAHIEYVFDCLDGTTSKVGNIKAYVLATLFNAPATIDEYYRAEVNHDYPMNRRRKAH
ncbi:MAG: helix-turn-helix domain-containing protein [Ruminococcus sp.]|nr:helix-turn-helix domain-containing protein [Ruminococcus sp.]